MMRRTLHSIEFNTVFGAWFWVLNLKDLDLHFDSVFNLMLVLGFDWEFVLVFLVTDYLVRDFTVPLLKVIDECLFNNVRVNSGEEMCLVVEHVDVLVELLFLWHFTDVFFLGSPYYMSWRSENFLSLGFLPLGLILHMDAHLIPSLLDLMLNISMGYRFF